MNILLGNSVTSLGAEVIQERCDALFAGCWVGAEGIDDPDLPRWTVVAIAADSAFPGTNFTFWISPPYALDLRNCFTEV